MRILIIHNHYQDPGGEDVVLQQEFSLLANSETVETFITKNSRGIAGFLQFLAYPFNMRASRKLDKVLREFNPDVVHLHNIHYATGPQLIRLLHKRKIPMVMTLHNYRLVCPSATLFHRGELFPDSINSGFPWKAVRLGVHQGSIFKTFWIAFTYYLHKKLGTWKMVDKYLVLTEFARKVFTGSKAGIPVDKLIVKPNFIRDSEENKAQTTREEYFLFIGRLSREKGIGTLIEAFQNSGAQLRIAGDGPMKDYVVQKCNTEPNLHYMGALKPEQVREQMKQCTALVFPSEWYEGMPMTLIEAFATGTAVLASRLGAMSAMVQENWDGFLFTAGDPGDLRACVAKWRGLDTQSKDRIRRNARKNYEEHYTAEANKQQLMGIYQDLQNGL